MTLWCQQNLTDSSSVSVVMTLWCQQNLTDSSCFHGLFIQCSPSCKFSSPFPKQFPKLIIMCIFPGTNWTLLFRHLSFSRCCSHHREFGRRSITEPADHLGWPYRKVSSLPLQWSTFSTDCPSWWKPVKNKMISVQLQVIIACTPTLWTCTNSLLKCTVNLHLQTKILYTDMYSWAMNKLVSSSWSYFGMCTQH